VTIRIIDTGQEVAAPWSMLTADVSQDMAGWRVYCLSDADSGLIVDVGHSDAWRQEEQVESLGGLMLPVLLVALIAVRQAVASALRPTTRFAQACACAAPRPVLSPLGGYDLPQELAPISHSLNGYLDSIRIHVEAERLFAAHAAHELRTPIAAASAQAQLIVRGLGDDEAPHRMTAALRRLGQLVERLLDLSRAEAGPTGGEGCDLVQVTPMVIAETEAEVVFDDGDFPDAWVDTHPDALALLLLRNAEDHGTGSIRVTLSPGPRLAVSNRTALGAAFRHGTSEHLRPHGTWAGHRCPRRGGAEHCLAL